MASMIDRQVTRLGVTDQEIAFTLVTMKRKMDEMTGLVEDLENMVGSSSLDWEGRVTRRRTNRGRP